MTKLLSIVLVLTFGVSVVGLGCEEEEGQRFTSPLSDELSSTLVPNTELDIYIHVEQDETTTLPADVIDMPFDVVAESLAIWGVPEEDGLVFGGSLVLASADQASQLYDEIRSEVDLWSKLSDNNIFFVEDSGIVTEKLKTIISENDFKYYDDEKSLQVVALLPNGESTEVAAIAIAEPSKAVVGRITEYADVELSALTNLGLRVARLEIVVAGLYSPHQIDVADIERLAELDSSVWESTLGLLIIAKFGFPGFIVQPIVKRFLSQYEFSETTLGELTLYKRFFDADGDKDISVLIRIEGSYVFIAISGQESYTQTLITSVNT